METLAMIGASMATAAPAAAGTTAASAIPAGMATAGGMASGVGTAGAVGAGAAGAGTGALSGLTGALSAIQNPALSKAFLMATPGAMASDVRRMAPTGGGGSPSVAPPSLSTLTPMARSAPPPMRPMQFGDRNAATLQMLAQLLAKRGR